MFTLYQIKNKINNKIYIGVHETNDPYDSYYGSGKLILNALKKHGKKNFEKTILYIFDIKEEAYFKESEIVNEEFILRNDTYNITIGGNVPPNQDKLRMIHTITGEQKFFDLNLYKKAEEYGWVPWSKNKMRVINGKGDTLWIDKNFEIPEGFYIWTKGMKVMKDNEGNTIWISKDDPNISKYTSIIKDTVTVIDHNGEYLRISKDDPRYISGELKGVNFGKKGLADHLNDKKYTCDICKKVVAKGNLKRWHNEKCKNKSIV